MEQKAPRYPVCRDRIGSADGYVHVTDLAFESMTGEREPNLPEMQRPILCLRDSMPLTECLRRFQVKQASLAVVVDRSGKVAGLLSPEDIIEEIVGEIRDEFDPDRAFEELIGRERGLSSALEAALASDVAEVIRVSEESVPI